MLFLFAHHTFGHGFHGLGFWWLLAFEDLTCSTWTWHNYLLGCVYLVVLLTRIELVARPYQGRVLPLYYRSMVSATRIELVSNL